MSFGIESKKLKKLVDYYSPLNNGQEIKFLTFFKGDQGLLRYLQTSPFQGIDSTSLQERIAWFGSNQQNNSKLKTSMMTIMLYPLTHFGMKIHLFISIVAFVISFFQQQHDIIKFSWLGSSFNLIMSVLIYIILLIPEIYQYLDNQKLKSQKTKSYPVKVWRDNQKKQILSQNLVVGDIVQVQKGDFIAADGLILEGGITVKEPINYKQIIVQKFTTKKCTKIWAQFQQKQVTFSIEDRQPMPSPIVLNGSDVIDGEARILVLCVGRFSRLGYFIQQIDRSAIQRRSQVQRKISLIMFQVSKYMFLSMILLVLLYITKKVVFLIRLSSFSTQNWKNVFVDFVKAITVVVLGLPTCQIFGLAIGSLYIKYKIYMNDGIWFKYIKDCANINDVTSMVFDRVEYQSPLKLVKWWNIEEQDVSNEKTIESTHLGYEQKFQESLRSKDFQPYQVGLKMTSFFVGMNKRCVNFLQNCLFQYAKRREKYFKTNKKQGQQQPEIKILSNLNEIEDQKEIIYLKGNSETLLKQCTHILNKRTCKIEQITDKLRQKITELIWQMNASQQASLITGYIEVHPNHPKFREPGYKIVMLSLISYKQSNYNQQFQSLARMRKIGMNITLMGNHSHEQTVSLCKEMGIIMIDKPSIRLRGYDFNKIVGGIICKNCKKSTCICIPESKYSPCLKNQDQFNKICKHLNVLSQANCIQKTTFAIGFACAKQKICFFGTSINDVPAMRLSSLSIVVNTEVQDNYPLIAAEVILPDKKLVTIEKLLVWGNYYHQFCQKYLTFALTPCLVAFISSSISFILYDNFCVTLLQFIWLIGVICPIVGLTFVLGTNPITENYEENRKKQQPIFNQISHRQLSSQVLIQTLVLLLIMIFGPSFIPQQRDKIDQVIGDNWGAKYYTESKDTICSGISNNIFNDLQQVYMKTINQYGIYSRHMTFIFNLFVLMQIVNYFNCRNLSQKSVNFVDEFSIYKLFCIFIPLGLQVFIISIGGTAFGIYPSGLTLKQWAICLGISLIVALTGLITKQIPYQKENEQKFIKVWPNRCYNLSVMATVPRQSLQDFQIDEQLQIRKMALLTNQ